MSDRDTVVTSIECWACSVPLATPLDFGSFVIDSREYVAVRTRTDGGLTADVVGLSRSTPIDLVITEVLGQHLLGRDATDTEGCLIDLARATRPLDQQGILGAARSLVGTCLWDLKAQSLGVPLWQALGGDGSRHSLPVLLVEGYALPGEDDDAFAERLASRICEGYRAIKVEAASYRDPARLGRRLARFRELVGFEPVIVVDLAWSWESVPQALAIMDTWGEIDAAWIEDPFLRHRVNDMRRLKLAAKAPIGAGDEATRPQDLIDMIEADAIDIVRVDALTIGGPSMARALTELAVAHGKGVSTHAHPEIHQHLSFAWPGNTYIEEFPVDRPFDFTHELIQGDVISHPETGTVSAPTKAGTGVKFVDEAIARFSSRYSLAPAR